MPAIMQSALLPEDKAHIALYRLRTTKLWMRSMLLGNMSLLAEEQTDVLL